MLRFLKGYFEIYIAHRNVQELTIFLRISSSTDTSRKTKGVKFFLDGRAVLHTLWPLHTHTTHTCLCKQSFLWPSAWHGVTDRWRLGTSQPEGNKEIEYDTT